MGGSGGGGKKKKSNERRNTSSDNSMSIWQAEMEAQRRMQQEQQAALQRSLEQQRAREEAARKAEEAKREQERFDSVQKEKDRVAKTNFDASSQAAAAQATGVLPGTSIPSAAGAKMAVADKNAPGLSPFGQSLKAGNLFYSPGGIKLGGY
jgi:hypothetical protein